MNKKIIILQVGTKAPGGILTVINNYFSDDLYPKSHMHLIYTNKNTSSLNNFLFFLNSFLKIMVKIIIHRSHLIIHAHSAMNGSFFRKTLILYFAKLFQSKFILHIHGSEFKDFYKNSNFFIKSYIKKSLEYSNCVIVLSQSWKDFFVKISSAKIKVVNNYIKEPQSRKKEFDNNLGFGLEKK